MLHQLPALRDFTRISSALKASVVAIGNFDGLHRGHRLLLKEMENSPSLTKAVLTFNPRPKVFFCQRAGQALLADNLFSEEQKFRAFLELGINYVLNQPFSEAFSQLSPEDFYQQLLRRYLGAKKIIVGENFYFGHKRQGNTDWLREHTARDKLALGIIPAAEENGLLLSSTRIRTALDQGKVEIAAQLLGRPYLLEGSSLQGAQLGRTLGFPTINLVPPNQQLPAKGVYAGYVWLGHKEKSSAPPIFPQLDKLYPAVFNLGLRPTLNSLHPSLHLEAHLLETQLPLNLYGLPCGFYFSHFIRCEQKFASLDELKQQIKKDISFARSKLL